MPIDALEGAAQRAGWEKVMDDPRDGNRPHRVAWEGPWEDLRVYYIDDHLIGVPYLIVRGPDSERALEDVMETLPSHTLDPAIMNALAARESEDKKTAIRRIGVLSGAAEPDPAVLALFDAAFIDPDPEVRRAAIGAATYPAVARVRAAPGDPRRARRRRERARPRPAGAGLVSRQRMGVIRSS